MDAKAKTEFLEQEITERIAGAKRRRAYYRRWAIVVAMSGAALSATTTVFIALGQVLGQQGWSIAALLTSALMSFLIAYEGFMRNKQMWIQANRTLMQLNELQSDLAFRQAGSDAELPEAELDKFYARYKDVLAAANRSWESFRTKGEAKGSKVG